MRNVSGYLTDDGRFFQDKKEAEAHERLLGVNKLHITSVTKPEPHPHEQPNDNEARIGDFHMSLFTAEEWQELPVLIERAIREVTR